MSDWRTKSVRDLFFYFLYNRRQLQRNRSVKFSGRDHRSTALKARFKDEIYRLRRAVGRNVIVFDEEYYRLQSQA